MQDENQTNEANTEATEVAAVGVPPETVTSRTTVLEPSCVTAAYEAMPTATAARRAAPMAKIRVISSFRSLEYPSRKPVPPEQSLKAT